MEVAKGPKKIKSPLQIPKEIKQEGKDVIDRPTIDKIMDVMNIVDVVSGICDTQIRFSQL